MKKIMFNDHLALTQAVLERRKTMTRRFLTQNYDSVSCINANYEDHWRGELDGEIFALIPRYEIGEVVAIAQSYKDLGYPSDTIQRGRCVRKGSHCSDWEENMIGKLGDWYIDQLAGWNNKMFVLSEMCKHHIRITDIYAERLQDISDEDCLKEGIRKMQDPFIEEETVYDFKGSDCLYVYPKTAFSALIDKVSGKGTWERNLWVFAYTYKLED